VSTTIPGAGSARPIVDPDEIAGLDFADPRLHAERDLTEVWRHLRGHEPVRWQPSRAGRPGFWIISRYADVSAVYKDRAGFTTERGNALGTLLHGGDSAAGTMLAVTDGERHDRIRNLLLKVFAPRSLELIRDSLRRSVDELLDAAIERGECDFAREVAGKVPLSAVCDLLEVPAGDREYLLGLTSHAWSSDHADAPAEDTWTAKNEILLYFADLCGVRRGTAGTDVVSLLANSTIDGRHLTEAEMIANCYGLMIGGDETGRHAITGTALALAENPDQWQAFRDGAIATDTAVEEALRWTHPSLHGGRSVVRDTEVGGVALGAGDIVSVWISSANRDEEVFDQPDRFRLDRTLNRHLTFALGSHFCLGAYLARMELEAVLDGLRRRVSWIEQTGPGERIYSSILSGLSTLPVVLHPAS
jgi:novobiocin biosynthesis protein NovI